MMKKNTTIIKPQSGAITRPDFIKPDIGLEKIVEYIVPPRFKIVQKMADEHLLVRFRVGDIIAVPDLIPIYEPNRNDRGDVIEDELEGLRFTPLFFFPEWVVWNPYKMKGSLPATRARSLDPKSEIAIKAKSQALWEETCPENPEENIRYCEHLNFIVRFLNHPYESPIVVSFSRAEHFTGRQFCNLLKMRNAAIFGNVFEMRLLPRKNAAGSWWGIQVSNPPADPWVTEKQYTAFEKEHMEFEELSSKIQVSYDDDKSATEVQTEF